MCSHSATEGSGESRVMFQGSGESRVMFLGPTMELGPGYLLTATQMPLDVFARASCSRSSMESFYALIQWNITITMFQVTLLLKLTEA